MGKGRCAQLAKPRISLEDFSDMPNFGIGKEKAAGSYAVSESPDDQVQASVLEMDFAQMKPRNQRFCISQ